MNTSLVKTAPQGDFTEVSSLVAGWEARLHALASQHRKIKCDRYPLPEIPPEIQNRLHQQGYTEQVLENDRWQHFFVPKTD